MAEEEGNDREGTLTETNVEEIGGEFGATSGAVGGGSSAADVGAGGPNASREGAEDDRRASGEPPEPGREIGS